MGAQGGRKGSAPSPHSLGESGPRAVLFTQQEMFIEHPWPVCQNRWTPGPASFVTPAAPPLSLQFKLRPQRGGAGIISPGEVHREEDKLPAARSTTTVLGSRDLARRQEGSVERRL